MTSVEAWNLLRDRYVRISPRYAEVYGAPPELSNDLATLQASIAMMVNALNKRTDPEARAATQARVVEARVTISDGQPESVSGDVELLDAEGRRVGFKLVTLRPVNMDATLRTVLEGLVAQTL